MPARFPPTAGLAGVRAANKPSPVRPWLGEAESEGGQLWRAWAAALVLGSPFVVVGAFPPASGR